MKQAITIKKAFKTADTKVPILLAEILLKIVLAALANKAKNAKSMYSITYSPQYS